jgi:hypothetical protein
MTRVKSEKREATAEATTAASGKRNFGENKEPVPLIALKRDLSRDLRNLAQGRENRQNHRST